MNALIYRSQTIISTSEVMLQVYLDNWSLDKRDSNVPFITSDCEPVHSHTELNIMFLIEKKNPT